MREFMVNNDYSRVVNPYEGFSKGISRVGSLLEGYYDRKSAEEERAYNRQRQEEADSRATELYNRQIAESDRAIAQRDLLNTKGREAIQRLPADMLASNPALLEGMGNDAVTAFNLSAERLAQGDDERFKKIHSLMQRANTGKDIEAADNISLEDSNYYRSKVLNSTPATDKGFTSTQSELMSGFDNQLIVKEDAERLLRSRLLEAGIDLDKVEPLVQQYTGGFTTRAQLTEMGKAERERAIQAQKESYEREKDKLELGIKVLKEVSDMGTKSATSGKVEDASKYWPAVTPYIHGEGKYANIFSSQMTDKELAGMAMGIEGELQSEGGLTAEQARNVTLAAINQARSSDWTGVKLTPAELKVKVKELAGSIKPDTAPDANAAARTMANKLQEQISKLGANVRDIPAAASPEQLVVQANTGRLRGFIEAIDKPVTTRLVSEQAVNKPVVEVAPAPTLVPLSNFLREEEKTPKVSIIDTAIEGRLTPYVPPSPEELALEGRNREYIRNKESREDFLQRAALLEELRKKATLQPTPTITERLRLEEGGRDRLGNVIKPLDTSIDIERLSKFLLDNVNYNNSVD
jgi:hypothetical protein